LTLTFSLFPAGEFCLWSWSRESLARKQTNKSSEAQMGKQSSVLTSYAFGKTTLV
jgi:hypothetical protein